MYLNFYRLKQFPFTLTPEPRFLSACKNRKEIADQIIEEIGKNGELIALIGDRGCGKTTIVQSLVAPLARTYSPILFLQKIPNALHFLKSLRNQLGMQSSSLSIDEMTITLIDRFEELATGRERVILIFDDAHLLDKNILEILRIFLQFNSRHPFFLRIFLAGEPELEEVLKQENKENLWDRTWLKIWLHPLSLEETKLYIHRRLQMAMDTSRPGALFDDQACEKIHHIARGNLRKINILCNNALVVGFLQSAAQINAELIEKIKTDQSCVEEVKRLVAQKRRQAKGKQRGTPTRAGWNASAGLPPESGMIPEPKEIKGKSHFQPASRKTISSPFLAGEAFRDLRRIVQSLHLQMKHRSLQVIGITAPGPRQGTTTVAISLAKMLSHLNPYPRQFEKDSGVLLIDGNIARPRLQKHFGLQDRPGFIEWLQAGTPLEQTIYYDHPLGISILPAGMTKGMPFSPLLVEQFHTHLSQLKKRYSMILLDLPSVLQDAMGINFCGVCDGVILVVRAGTCKWEVVAEAKRLLEQSGITILGAILNARKFFIPSWLYNIM